MKKAKAKRKRVKIIYISRSDNFRNGTLLKLAKKSACMSCFRDDGTVVAAHNNKGKGMGFKSSDWEIAYLCHICHDLVDGRRGGMSAEERQKMFDLAHVRTVRFWHDRGIL